MKSVLAALLCVLALAPPEDPAPARGTLVVLNKSEASASLLDPASGAVLATLPVGAGPHEAATSPDGRTVVVCNYGQDEPGSSLTVLDPRTREVRATIDLGPYQRPHGIAFLPDGARVAVTCEVQRKLVVVDVAKGEVSAAHDTTQYVSHMVALAPDGARAYVANIGSGSVSVLDLAKGELVRTVATGAGCEGIAVRPGSGEVWTTNRGADTLSILAPDTLEVTATLACGAFPIRVAFTPDGARALVSCARADAVEVWDAAKRERLATIPMTVASVAEEEREGRVFSDAAAQAMPVGILVRPDGREAYVANTMADQVTVLDLQTLAVKGHLRAGKEPDGMCWVPPAAPDAAPETR
ncbi:MAG: beta-propeller fold lactonase family protein [Planctomycetes bacterium]|nr:beta-propeller fold lactonase family protein [Planctomycetota bacterium]